MRTFIALELLPEIQKAIAQVIEKLKEVEAPIKWVEEKNLHLTLKFLGEVPEAKLKDLESAVSEAVKGGGSFPASFEGSGVFPDERRPRVVWVGAKEGSEKIVALARSLEEGLVAQGFGKSEERDFTSHVTIGRVKEKRSLPELIKKLAEIKDVKFGKQIVDRITIMKSTLTPQGPIYEAIARIKL